MYSDGEVQTMRGDRPPTQSVEDNLKMRKVDLERQLTEITACIDALEKNPNILSILNLMRRVGV